jgi:hypothetical protein
VNPVGKEIAEPSDHFLLSLADAGLRLRDLMDTIRLFNSRFTHAVRNAAQTSGPAEGALLPITVEVTPE